VKPRCSRTLVHHTCADCGKQTYQSRADAKAAMKRWGDSQGCHAYRCGDGWHFGHKPAALVRGLIGREDIGGQPQS
jgi:hypothetical protein